MKRIFLMFLRNFFYLPKMLILLNRYAKNPDKYSPEKIYEHMYFITERALKAGKVHVEITGQENIPETENFIFYPNHQGYFDPLAIVYACKRPLSIVFKKSLASKPFLKQVLTATKSRAIDREDVRQSMTVIKGMASDVKNGSNYLIFAEGTRSKKGNHLLDFKGGSFKAAYMAKCPVVPCALIDTYKVMDTGNTKEITVYLHILKPIPYEEYKDMKTTELASHVHDLIENEMPAE